MKRLPALLDATLRAVAMAWFAVETAAKMLAFYIHESRTTHAKCPTCGRSTPEAAP